jgi:hypothetical protein
MRTTRALRRPVPVGRVLSVVRRCAGQPEEDDDGYRRHIESGAFLGRLRAEPRVRIRRCGA